MKLVYIICLVLLIIYLWDNCIEDTNTKIESYANVENSDSETILKVDTLKCGPECCKFNQWPLPQELQNKTLDDTFIGSNFSCGNSNKSGCVCIQQKDYNILNRNRP